ncbi:MULTISPECIES: arylsulfatase [unclassified Saccharicrinis]|uniref:arylsulfatase n=1 Tax=unclassified Saccharicrinis TaxID=2646859 RepID=UPI003D325487
MRFKLSILLVLICSALSAQKTINKPNVILILTDDQGIGDLGCHGNPWLKTPNLDSFYNNAVRMTDFHVSSVCTPSRGAIMTGLYPINNGAWATYKGRDALSGNAMTMADIFKANNYTTAMFGKWHLGDNYPVRPTDCGFDVAIQHKAGGVGELSDYWGNTYFDDVYFVNNTPKQFEGYCTDVWFNEAIKFMDNHHDKPFFIYLPTNAPHGPHYVAEKYAEPYKSLVGEKIMSAEFYGMISNIDENFGKLEKYLKKKKIADNTILIFMTDNGTHYGVSADGKLGWNHGFRGRKGGKQEGSHRVPFFIRWKDGKIKGGKDIDEETAHVDLIPTLAALCKLEIPQAKKLDGIDFSPLLTDKKAKLKDRTIFVHNRQDWRPPTDVDKTCIIKDEWRLVDGKGLYNIEQDREQRLDLSAQHPDIKEEMLKNNAAFLRLVKTNPVYHELPVSIVGNDIQKEITLTIQHAIGEGRGIWKAEQVAAGMKNSNNKHSIEVEKAGLYIIECRRWPKECPGPIWGIPSKNPKDFYTYKTIKPQKVRIQLANQIHEKEIVGDEEAVVFKLYLPKGKTLLVNDFIEGREKYGVYYTYIKPVGKE